MNYSYKLFAKFQNGENNNKKYFIFRTYIF